MTPQIRGAMLILFTAACVAAVFLVPPFAQPLDYHNFADRRSLLGVPNFGDVLSNLPFLLVGLAGLWALRPGGRTVFVDRLERFPYIVFFVGVALTAFGSSYYHLAPDNARLVFDRLPMTVAFMGLVSALIAERVQVLLGRSLTMPAVVTGLASVWYWKWSAAQGAENLIPYLILQGYAIGMVLLLATLYRPRYTHGTMLAGVVAWYLLAKLFEWGDATIYAFDALVSGHTLKHLASALATYWVLRMLNARRALTEVATA
jgi:hypothetical protein